MKKIFFYPIFTILLFIKCIPFAFAQNIDHLLHQKNDPVAGNPKGPITIVEFFDYQCMYCSDMVPVIQSTLKRNPNIRVIYKELPLKGYLSRLAAKAALAANKQGKYAPYSHSLLLTNEPLSEGLLYRVAMRQGLNMAQFKKDMNDPEINNQVKQNLELAERLNLNGTPAFFIGKTNAKHVGSLEYFLGGLSKEEIQEAVAKAS